MSQKFMLCGSIFLLATFHLPANAESVLDRLKGLADKAKAAQQAKPAANNDAASAEPEIKIPPVGHVSLEDEVRLGRQIAGNLLGAAPLVKDANLQQYVNQVGAWVALARRPHSPRNA